MKNNHQFGARRWAFVSMSAVVAAVLAACGGGGSGGDSKTTLAGVAVDGYLKGAKVCLDLNDNNACDSGEPEATTDESGRFSMSVDAQVAASHRVLVQVLAGVTVDQDNPGTPIEQGYTLSAPIGKQGVVSPLTTLVAAKMLGGSTQADAEAWALTQLGLSDKAKLYNNYVGSDADTHALAKRVVELTLQGQASLTGVTTSLEQRAEEIKTNAKAVAIDFAALAGDTPVACGQDIGGLGTTGATGQLSDLRFYISNVKLVKQNGTEVPVALGANTDWNATSGNDSVTLIDLEDKSGNCGGTTATNTLVQGTVPAGNYVGIKMTLGVPFAMNHTDQTAITDEVTPAVIRNDKHPGMAWNWAGGRKFTKIEVTNSAWTAITPKGAAKFNVHLGSTDCTGSSPSTGLISACGRPDRVDVTFAAFNPETQKIALDVQALLASNDVTQNVSGPGGCMSGSTDPECAGIFTRLNLDLATGTSLPTGSQSVFKLISKPAVQAP